MLTPRREPSSGDSESSGSQTEAPPEPGLEARQGDTLIAIAITAMVAVIFIWWALKQGGYFDSVFLPGATILYGLLILLLVGAPFRVRIKGPALVALVAIAALPVWILLSLTWSDSKDAALQYAQHGFLYATVFALGMWACNLAGRRAMLPLAAVAATGVVAGIVTTITLASGTDVSSYLHADATLRFPIGYRNAEAAFLLICLWPIISLAAEGGLPWQVRALLIGAATMVLELAVLSESRGSLPAAAVSLAVFLALSPRRLRAAMYLGLAALPVLPALPTLLDLFQNGYVGDDAGVLPFLRDSARAIALTSVASIVLAAVCIRGIEMRIDLGEQRVKLISRVAAVAAAAVLVVGGAAFVAERGGPVGFLDQRISEFERGGNPNLQPVGTRFGVNVGTNRGDFWRVALDEGKDDPLFGAGAGSFGNAYLRNRESVETPQDPHSVELLMVSELGAVGLLLFVALVAAAAISGLSSRRVGSSAAALTAASLAAGAYWLVHSSYDWFWNYPSLTAPAMFLLGAAAAPALFHAGQGGARRVRYVAAGAAAVVLIAALPPFLSQRYANHAYDESARDPGTALRDLDRAADLNPFNAQPLLAKGFIESRLGNERESVAAFRDALEREPDGYAPHYFLAQALAPSDRAAALAEIEEAARLNPLDRRVLALERRLEQKTSP